MNKQVKQLFRLWKQHKKRIKRYGTPLVFGVAIFLLGMFTQKTYLAGHQPLNIVWAVDKTVKVPQDLRQTLEKRDDCNNYRGADQPGGVGLWGVIQVEDNKFAKLSYGCSLTLTSYMLAVKQDNKWVLLKPVEYFSNTSGGVPVCTMITKYNIPGTIESFCTNDKGDVVKNPTP